MKLEINYGKKVKKHKYVETKQHATKRPMEKEKRREEKRKGKEGIKPEIKNYLETNKNENNFSKFMECSKSSSMREVLVDCKKQKITIKQFNSTPKETRKEEKRNPK